MRNRFSLFFGLVKRGRYKSYVLCKCSSQLTDFLIQNRLRKLEGCWIFCFTETCKIRSEQALCKFNTLDFLQFMEAHNPGGGNRQYSLFNQHWATWYQPLFRVPRLPAFSWSMDYLNTIYIQQTDLGVGFNNLMNNLKSLTFSFKTFQLLLSTKSQLNVRS